VVGREVRCHRGQQTGCFITGRLHHFAVKLRQGRCHQVIPGVLITALRPSLEANEVAYRLHPHQAQATRTGCVLGEGEGVAGHVLGQARGFRVAIGHQRFFNLAVDLLLSPRRGRDKPIQAGEVAQATDQAKATRSDLDADQVEGHNQPMEEGEPRTTLKERSHLRTDVEGGVPLAPGLQRGSRNIKPLGGLSLRDALRLSRKVLSKHVGPLVAFPAQVTTEMVAVLQIHSSAHRGLPVKPLPNPRDHGEGW
jgi:hypothetical protein